ncbi:MAG: AAA family ATPase [Planctomycetes bacterium]|nr:AAA family ATPase [Planctomycetota bacterium]
MITLTKAQVFKYKSIEDSLPVEISDDVTVLVGKNESGKTAFLEALHKALPVGNAKFNFVFDYPRKDYVRDLPRHVAKSHANVVELTFCIEKDLADKINTEVFNDTQVIQPGHAFTWTTNYGNSSTIGFSVDQAAAIAALKKPLEGIEHADEVFAKAKRLEDVVAKIEAKELQSDSTLAVFAKEWQDRFAKVGSGWDLIGGHLWNEYISPMLPRFLYFDDYRLLNGKINLESLNHRKDNNQLTETDETTFGLFDLAGIELKELMSEEGYENSKAKLEAIGLTITKQVFEYWKQNKELAVEFDIKADPKDQPPFNNGKNLYIRVKNLRHGVTVPFDQRSKGFIWFFSFMVWFSAVEDRTGTDKDLILLLDEPGLNLHALAQADFLSYIDTLSDSHQIIYTTHSPFMVESDRLEKVRVVEDHPRNGSTVTEKLEGAADESLFPLQAALGYSIAQNLFIAKKNVLVEGPADFLILQHMSALLEGAGKPGLAEGVFVPVGGLSNLTTFIALLGASKLRLVVLHDRPSAPPQTLENLIRQRLIERKRVLNFSMFRTPDNLETDIEDLFPVALYVDAFNAAYANELKGNTLTVSKLGQHPRIIERINQWLEKNSIALLKNGGFNHYRVACALLPKLTGASLSATDVQRFENLFARVNAALT